MKQIIVANIPQVMTANIPIPIEFPQEMEFPIRDVLSGEYKCGYFFLYNILTNYLNVMF
jgi:hypothetical protein